MATKAALEGTVWTVFGFGLLTSGYWERGPTAETRTMLHLGRRGFKHTLTGVHVFHFAVGWHLLGHEDFYMY